MNGNLIDWNAIETFVGYGNPAAGVVFVGIEEGLSSLDNLEHDLFSRSGFDAVMDLYIAHIGNGANGIAGAANLFHVEHPTCQTTWRPMCDLMLRRDRMLQGGNPNNPTTLADRNQYQATQLGRHDSNTLLTELLPYPHVNASSWEHNLYVNRYSTRNVYEIALLPMRLNLLSQAFAKFPRSLIVCYGRAQWPSFSILVDRYRTLVGAAPVVWHINDAMDALSANVGATRIVLVNHFSRPPLSTDRALPGFYNLCYPHPPE